MSYAENTSVAFEKSIAEIITLIKRAGAQQIGQFESDDHFAIQFVLADRLIRFRVPLPGLDTIPARNGNNVALNLPQRKERLAQSHRQRGRALLLVIKAKLESVESGIETLEQAFLAHVVMADGATVYERIAEPLAVEYRTGAPNVTMGLLPAPSGGAA
jgi:hypothetical protein